MKITISTKIDDDVLKTYKIFNTGERQFELDILIYLVVFYLKSTLLPYL